MLDRRLVGLRQRWRPLDKSQSSVYGIVIPLIPTENSLGTLQGCVL